MSLLEARGRSLESLIQSFLISPDINVDVNIDINIDIFEASIVLGVHITPQMAPRF